MPIDSWIAEDDRRLTPDVDFGMHWIDPEIPDRRCRLSWIPDTGELYITDLGMQRVRVLAVILRRSALEHVLVGWDEVGAGPEPMVTWIEAAVSRNGSHATDADHHR